LIKGSIASDILQVVVLALLSNFIFPIVWSNVLMFV